MDEEHCVLEAEGLARYGEAGEADAGREGEGEGVGARGAPDTGSGIGGGDGGRDTCGGCFAGAVDEGDAVCFGQSMRGEVEQLRWGEKE